MSTRSRWGVTPRQSIEAECSRRGKQAVVDGCVGLILGEEADADTALVMALAGPSAHRVLVDDSRTDQRHWLRVWGTRGLLWAWEDNAFTAVESALHDPAWRAREIAAKVVAKHLLGDALPTITKLHGDPVPRVRAAAQRATVRLTATGA